MEVTFDHVHCRTSVLFRSPTHPFRRHWTSDRTRRLFTFLSAVKIDRVQGHRRTVNVSHSVTVHRTQTVTYVCRHNVLCVVIFERIPPSLDFAGGANEFSTVSSGHCSALNIWSGETVLGGDHGWSAREGFWLGQSRNKHTQTKHILRSAVCQ